MSSCLQITIECLRDRSVEMDIEIESSRLDLEDNLFKFVAPVKGKLTFHLADDDVICHGSLSTMIQADCMRCLAPTQATLNISVDEVWIPHHKQGTNFPKTFDDDFSGIEEEEIPLTHTYHGDIIDLDGVLRELIMAELPMRLLCSEACKGLCPNCGENLNSSSCNCSPQEKQGLEEQRQPEWKTVLKSIKLKTN